MAMMKMWCSECCEKISISYSGDDVLVMKMVLLAQLSVMAVTKAVVVMMMMMIMTTVVIIMGGVLVSVKTKGAVMVMIMVKILVMVAVVVVTWQ